MSIPSKIITSLAFLSFVATVVIIFSNQNRTAFAVNEAVAEQTTLIASNTGKSRNKAQPDSDHSNLFSFTMNDIDGKPLPLSAFKGQVIMVVNTASFCGNTPQYGGLQTLYERYRDQGFTILAFPANDFGKQEPGENKEIAEFCYTKYSLEFPLFSKITVLGENKHPLYRYLTEHTPFKGEISWNFQKFLIDRTGNVIARYRPGMKPLTRQIVSDIEGALKQT
ncbi:MAG: glutathione peroxidase [Nitrospirales bacterium]